MLTNQDMVDYIYIKGDTNYSLEEVVAVFCVGDIQALPPEFSLGLLKRLTPKKVYMKTSFRTNLTRETLLIERVENELGEEGYLQRLQEVLLPLTTVLAKYTYKEIMENITWLSPCHDGERRMRSVMLIIQQNWEEQEVDDIQYTIKQQFKNTFKDQFSDEDNQRGMAYERLDKMNYQTWDRNLWVME